MLPRVGQSRGRAYDQVNNADKLPYGHGWRPPYFRGDCHGTRSLSNDWGLQESLVPRTSMLIIRIIPTPVLDGRVGHANAGIYNTGREIMSCPGAPPDSQIAVPWSSCAVGIVKEAISFGHVLTLISVGSPGWYIGWGSGYSDKIGKWPNRRMFYDGMARTLCRM